MSDFIVDVNSIPNVTIAAMPNVTIAAMPNVTIGAMPNVTIAGTPTVDTELPAAAALSDTLGNPTSPLVGSAGLLWTGSVWARAQGDATNGQKVYINPATTNAGNNGAANTAATLSTVAPGAGLFIYIDWIRLSRVATAALAGTALLTITTTNMFGLTIRCGNLIAAGDTVDVLKMKVDWKAQAAATAVTFVCPAAGAAVSWDLQAMYHIGP
jgi:hypothetical protein